MFQPHPNAVLNECFRQRPFQGVRPEHAQFLFVGLDANYAADVEQNLIFPSLLKYHEDGPNFWRTAGVHHPFLLPQYKGDGRRYHLRFSKIGFQPEHADSVSFTELLHRPTVGGSELTRDDLNRAHLCWIREAIFEGTAQFTFISAGVKSLMASSGLFPELSKVKRTLGTLEVLHEGRDRTVFRHLHFSNYGKFEQQLQSEGKEIAGLLARSRNVSMTLHHR